MDDHSEFTNKVALVTGAGRGLGRAIALSLSLAGAITIINDLTPINLDITEEQIRSKGGSVYPYLEDISKGLPARALINQIEDRFGRLDILINNAGVRPHASLEKMDEWDWQRTLDVNLSGPFLLMQAAVNPMREQGGGMIINIAANPPSQGFPIYQGAFYASKTALVALTQTAAKEFWNYNIRVHIICPMDLSSLGSYDLIIQQIQYLCSSQAVDQTGKIIRIGQDNSIQMSDAW